MTWQLLDRLEQWKSRFGSGKSVDLEKLLVVVRKRRFPDAASLIRLHETLLFLRAYPRSQNVAKLADEILFSFADRVAALETQGEDLSTLAEPEVSGIARSSFSAVFSYEVAQRLAKLHPRGLKINWEDYENADLGAVMSRFLPLLEEDWPVEANIPYRAWLRAAVPLKERGLSWLLERFDGLPVVAREQAMLYDSLQLPLVWDLGNSRSTRSRMRLPGGTLFCHDAPLLRRSDISLSSELAGPPLSLTKLSLMDARRILDMILDTSAIRYRELYGFTHPDTPHVFRADIGRGVQIFVFGVPPEWRLPLRAYHSALFFKNGVPIGYVEVLSLFERAEVGFNLYYTFREGESAWLYAQVLRLFRGLLGVSCFSVDPYQLGHHNQEALDSGAFWFYRKLGFRPVEPGLMRLVEREESRIRRQSGYRTPPRTLKKLAEGYMIFEGPGAQHGAWDRFRVRNIGFSVEHRMTRHFGGDAGKMRRETADHLASPREFLERLHSAEPGCLVVDLHTPELSGLELQEAMVRAGYHMPVIFMSGQADVRSIVKAMQGGAIDFLIKPFDQRQLLEAIDRAIARDLELRAERDTFRLNLLTPREREVCALVAAGRLNKQIAAKLGVTEKTIKAHLRRVMQKLQVRSLVELVRIVDQAR